VLELELARIMVWEPGVRLARRSSLDDVEVDVRFEAAGGGTRVRVGRPSRAWQPAPAVGVPPPPRRLPRARGFATSACGD